MNARRKIGVLITGDMKVFASTVSLLANRYDIVPLLDLIDRGLDAVVIPDSGAYNWRSSNVRPFKRIPDEILSVDNAYVLNLVDCWGKELRAIKTVALGMSALTIGDRMGTCKIHRESNSYSLGGAAKLKTSLLYLNIGTLESCIDEVIEFIESGSEGDAQPAGKSPLPVLDEYCDA